MPRFNGPYTVCYLQPNEKINDFMWLALRKDATTPKPGVIYVEFWDGRQQRLYFRCPCGGEQEDCSKYPVELNLDQELKQVDSSVPAWTFRMTDGIPDITPSIHNKRTGCHFFIRNGIVEWC